MDDLACRTQVPQVDACLLVGDGMASPAPRLEWTAPGKTSFITCFLFKRCLFFMLYRSSSIVQAPPAAPAAKPGDWCPLPNSLSLARRRTTAMEWI